MLKNIIAFVVVCSSFAAFGAMMPVVSGFSSKISKNTSINFKQLTGYSTGADLENIRQVSKKHKSVIGFTCLVEQIDEIYEDGQSCEKEQFIVVNPTKALSYPVIVFKNLENDIMWFYAANLVFNSGWELVPNNHFELLKSTISTINDNIKGVYGLDDLYQFMANFRAFNRIESLYFISNLKEHVCAQLDWVVDVVNYIQKRQSEITTLLDKDLIALFLVVKFTNFNPSKL